MKILKVGTRTSPLALKQTELVINQLLAIQPDLKFEIVGISTKGDRLINAKLSEIGGKGVFVKEVEYALLEEKIDFAVHSLKDMPAILHPNLILVATPKRATVNDCLILQKDSHVKNNLVIGTSSLRRVKQLSLLYPHWRFVDIRGKIETRLDKMATQHLDGIVLAFAGIERMAYQSKLPQYQLLDTTACVPAVGQAILGVECRKDDQALIDLLSQINDDLTWQSALAERQFLAAMNGNCDIPLGAYSYYQNNQWYFHAFLAKNNQDSGRHLSLSGQDVQQLAIQAAKDLLND